MSSSELENNIKAARARMIETIGMLKGKGRSKAIRIGADIDSLLADAQSGRLDEV